MMKVRVRSPEGLLRVDVRPEDKIKKIIGEITTTLAQKNIPITKQELYIFPNTGPLDPESTVQSHKFKDGEMLLIKYDINKSQLPPEETDPFKLGVIKDPIPPCYLHGKNASCVRCMTSQYQRINPQEKTKSGGVYVDRKAIMVFQYNVSQNLAFSVQRLGILYGTTDEEGWINVQYIYEPPQENSADNILLLRNPDEEYYVSKLATFFGLKKVGCIISQTVEDFSKSDDDEPFYLTAQQLLMVGDIHRDLTPDDPFIVLSLGMRDNQGVLEPFELSDRYYDLYNRRYFLPAEEKFFLQVKEPLWIQSKEESEVEVEFFIVPGNLKEYTSEFQCEFPVENRFVKQSTKFLKELLKKHERNRIPLHTSLYDFHLLLFLFPLLGEMDIENIIQHVKAKIEISEGHQMIIQVHAGLIQ